MLHKSCFNIILHLYISVLNGIIIARTVFINGRKFVLTWARKSFLVSVHPRHSGYAFITRELLRFSHKCSILNDKVVLVFAILLGTRCLTILRIDIFFVESASALAIVIEARSRCVFSHFVAITLSCT